MKRQLLNLGRWCLFGTWILGFGASALAADDPESQLASFQVAEGFEVKLFASEADGVVKPIQMRFDARGRLWVIGSTVYPQIEPGQKPNDKVLIVEDTNDDGRADKTTVFADGLMIPTGIEVIENGCYVGRGDVPTRQAAHKSDHLKCYEFLPIWNNNLNKATAKGLEQLLIETYGGAKSMNPSHKIENKARSYRNTNPNAHHYWQAVQQNPLLVEKTFERIKNGPPPLKRPSSKVPPGGKCN